MSQNRRPENYMLQKFYDTNLPNVPKNETDSRTSAEEKDYNLHTTMRLNKKMDDGTYHLKCLGREIYSKNQFKGDEFIDGIFPKGTIVEITNGNFPHAEEYIMREIDSGVSKRVKVVRAPSISACKNMMYTQCELGISLVSSKGGRLSRIKNRRRTKRRRVNRSTRRR